MGEFLFWLFWLLTCFFGERKWGWQAPFEREFFWREFGVRPQGAGFLVRLLGVGSPALGIRLPCRIPQTILARAPGYLSLFVDVYPGLLLVSGTVALPTLGIRYASQIALPRPCAFSVRDGGQNMEAPGLQRC